MACNQICLAPIIVVLEHVPRIEIAVKTIALYTSFKTCRRNVLSCLQGFGCWCVLLLVLSTIRSVAIMMSMSVSLGPSPLQVLSPALQESPYIVQKL